MESLPAPSTLDIPSISEIELEVIRNNPPVINTSAPTSETLLTSNPAAVYGNSPFDVPQPFIHPQLMQKMIHDPYVVPYPPSFPSWNDGFAFNNFPPTFEPLVPNLKPLDQEETKQPAVKRRKVEKESPRECVQAKAPVRKMRQHIASFKMRLKHAIALEVAEASTNAAVNFTSDSWRNISSKDADQFHKLFDRMVIETHCASAVARQIDLSFKSMLNESCSTFSQHMDELTRVKRRVEEMIALSLGELSQKDTRESQLREALALLEAITIQFCRSIPKVYNSVFLSDVADMISLAWLYLFSTKKHSSRLLTNSYAHLFLCVFYLYQQIGFDKSLSIFKPTLEYGAEMLEIASVSDFIKVL